MWVRSRQYTGRVVTVTDDKVFVEPGYNYTGDFPCLWEEIDIPIPYAADRERAERILYEASTDTPSTWRTSAARPSPPCSASASCRRPTSSPGCTGASPTTGSSSPLELSVRFLVPEHGIRDIKDAVSRDILKGLDAAGIGIASATLEVVRLPPLRVERARPAADGRRDGGA
jgi:small-conductance mechanosensitive channel